MVTSVFLKENKKIDNSARNNLCPKNHPAKKKSNPKQTPPQQQQTHTNQPNKQSPPYTLYIKGIHF